jgi:predicted RND superfamily exporter protein
MTPTDESEIELERRIDDIVNQGPFGAFAVAGVATAIVVAMFFIFYFVVYLPRGTVQ